MSGIFAFGGLSSSSSSRSRNVAKLLIASAVLIIWFLYIYHKVFYSSTFVSLNEVDAAGTSSSHSSATSVSRQDRDRKRNPKSSRPDSSEWRKWRDELADTDNEPIPVKKVITWSSFVKLQPSSKTSAHLRDNAAGAEYLDPSLQFHAYEHPIKLPNRCTVSAQNSSRATI